MIPLFKVFMPVSVDLPLLETLHSGYVGQGDRVVEFETLLGDYLGNPRVLTTNSGTSAIQLALKLAGVESGSEVVTTPVTCTASNMPVLAEGGRIVWADVNPVTGSIDPDAVLRRITSATRAVLAVHWGGGIR